MINLGETIELEGFECIEPAALIVVKKMVGSSAKKLSEKKAFEKLSLTLKESSKGSCSMSGRLIVGSKEFDAETTDINIFFAINKVFSELSSRL